jgi:hypothetical protein
MLIPHATHVSVLFDPRGARASQEWAARVLHLAPSSGLPSRLPLAGSLTGFLGLLLLAGPFLREVVGQKAVSAAAGGSALADDSQDEAFSLSSRSASRSCVEIAAASAIVVLLLRVWIPLRFIHLFEGDYLASFLLVVGVVLLLRHRRSAAILFRSRLSPFLGAAFAAIVLHLLIYAWLDVTITEAWLTPTRWLRFPAMFAAVLPYHVAEELLLGQATARGAKVLLLLALGWRFIAWSALLVGIFLLYNGQILLILLAPYFAVFCLLQRMGMGVVRRDTGSPMAAALFGAILLTGFSLVIFPIT